MRGGEGEIELGFRHIRDLGVSVCLGAGVGGGG